MKRLHVLTADQWSKKSLTALFLQTEQLRERWGKKEAWRGPFNEITKANPRSPGHTLDLNTKVIGLLFQEPSTRTMRSFEVAGRKLGASVISWTPGNSSIEKGESLADTMRTLNALTDCLVVRCEHPGTLLSFAKETDKPLINAGDGGNEHPTQALLDMYTIWRHRNELGNLNVLFCGDNEFARSMHSLKKLLQLFEGIEIVEEPMFGSLDEEQKHVHSGDLKRWHPPDLDKEAFHQKLGTADVVYVTRLQIERWRTAMQWSANADHPLDEHMVYTQFGRGITINNELLKSLNPDAIIMHPGPRRRECHPEIDADSRMKMWEMVENGMWIRMALLRNLLY